MIGYHVTGDGVAERIAAEGIVSIKRLEGWGDDLVWLFLDRDAALDVRSGYRRGQAAAIITVDLDGLDVQADPHTHYEHGDVMDGYESAVVVPGTVPVERVLDISIYCTEEVSQ